MKKNFQFFGKRVIIVLNAYDVLLNTFSCKDSDKEGKGYMVIPPGGHALSNLHFLHHL